MQPKACISNSFCSIRWLLAEPVAGARRSAAIDARERQPIEQLAAEARQQKPPGAHVLRLFLHPVDGRAVAIAGQRRLAAARAAADRAARSAQWPRRGGPGPRVLFPIRNTSCPSRAARVRPPAGLSRASGITCSNRPAAHSSRARHRLADVAAGFWASSPPAACATAAAPAGAAQWKYCAGVVGLTT